MINFKTIVLWQLILVIYLLPIFSYESFNTFIEKSCIFGKQSTDLFMMKKKWGRRWVILPMTLRKKTRKK